MITHRRYQRERFAVLVVERPNRPEPGTISRHMAVAILAQETDSRWTLAEIVAFQLLDGDPPSTLRRRVRWALRDARTFGRI